MVTPGLIGFGDLLYRAGEVTTYSAVRGRWPGGTLIYDFSPSVTADQQNLFEQACNSWSISTPVSCKKRSGERDYVLVETHSGDGCGAVTSCSMIGRTGGAQKLNVLESHWTSQRTLQHEIGHAFGLIHEQNRMDRDQYIFVRNENITANYQGDVAAKLYADPVSDYDYLSIMHYSNCGGTRHNNCSLQTRQLWTLEPKPCGLDKVGGDVISVLDRDGIRKAYAPGLFALFGTERAPECGTLSYGADVVPADTTASINYNKIETVAIEDCGSFVSKTWGHGLCVPLHKTEMSLDIDDDPFSCGFAWTATRFEATATCGCQISTLSAMCSSGKGGTLPSFVNAKTAGSWRAGRVQYLDNILNDLGNDGILEGAILSSLRDFYFINGADKRLESKLFRLRHKINSVGRWRKSRDEHFIIDRAMFNEFAKRERLRLV